MNTHCFKVAAIALLGCLNFFFISAQTTPAYTLAYHATGDTLVVTVQYGPATEPVTRLDFFLDYHPDLIYLSSDYQATWYNPDGLVSGMIKDDAFVNQLDVDLVRPGGTGKTGDGWVFRVIFGGRAAIENYDLKDHPVTLATSDKLAPSPGVYPNPVVRGQGYVLCEVGSTVSQIHLMDMQGKLVRVIDARRVSSVAYQRPVQLIPVEDLAPGMYWLHFPGAGLAPAPVIVAE